MIIGNTWIVVADGGVARFFERARPGANIVEREDLALRIEEAEPPRDRPMRVHDRMGPARHAAESRQSPRVAAEAKFLKQVGDFINSGAENGAFEALVLCAPPRPLGSLREALSKHARDKTKAELNKDLTHVPAHEMNSRLHDLLQWPEGA